MKKIAILADNYKLDKFKADLAAKGFTNIKITPFLQKGLSTISLSIPKDKVAEVEAICQLVEIHFKQSN